MQNFRIYNGYADRQAAATAHTAAITSCGTIKGSRFNHMTIREHGRSDWSLFFCERGRMNFFGAELNAQQIWIYEPQKRQQYATLAKDNTVYRYLHFSGSDMYELFTSLGIKRQTPISAASKDIPKLLDGIQAAVGDGGAHASLRAEYLCLRLFSQISPTADEREEGLLIKAVTDRMEHSFAEQYDSELFARMMNVSRDRFQHIFREVMGISPYAYYVGQRMENAVKLLLETNLKIKDIAEFSGYRDPFYFAAAFKSAKGTSPTEYRAIHKIK